MNNERNCLEALVFPIFDTLLSPRRVPVDPNSPYRLSNTTYALITMFCFLIIGLLCYLQSGS